MTSTLVSRASHVLAMVSARSRVPVGPVWCVVWCVSECVLRAVRPEACVRTGHANTYSTGSGRGRPQPVSRGNLWGCGCGLQMRFDAAGPRVPYRSSRR